MKGSHTAISASTNRIFINAVSRCECANFNSTCILVICAKQCDASNSELVGQCRKACHIRVQLKHSLRTFQPRNNPDCTNIDNYRRNIKGNLATKNALKLYNIRGL